MKHDNSVITEYEMVSSPVEKSLQVDEITIASPSVLKQQVGDTNKKEKIADFEQAATEVNKKEFFGE